MESFSHAKVVKLISCHVTYLRAAEDKETVIQGRNGTYDSARWAVEVVPSGNANSNSIIRLKSCYGKYLTASDLPLRLGCTGRKVLQTLPAHLDSSVDWEVDVVDRNQFRLKNCYSGSFLKANGGLPPWRNTVTHQIQNAISNKDWHWQVQVIEKKQKSLLKPSRTKHHEV